MATITKAMLKKGSVITVAAGADSGLFAECRRETYVVRDLFDRKNYNRPDSVGIGPADRGVAFGVRLDQITSVR